MHGSITQPYESCVNTWLVLNLSNIMKNRKGNNTHGTAAAMPTLQSLHTNQEGKTKYIVRTQGNTKHKMTTQFQWDTWTTLNPSTAPLLRYVKARSKYKVYLTITSSREEETKTPNQTVLNAEHNIMTTEQNGTNYTTLAHLQFTTRW